MIWEYILRTCYLIQCMLPATLTMWLGSWAIGAANHSTGVWIGACIAGFSVCVFSGVWFHAEWNAATLYWERRLEAKKARLRRKAAQALLDAESPRHELAELYRGGKGDLSVQDY